MPPLFGLLGTVLSGIGLGGAGAALGTLAAPTALATGLGTGIPAAIGIGTSIDQLVNQPQIPNMSQLLQQTSQQPGGQQAPTQQQIEQNVAQARQGATDTQANLGGALAPGFLEQIAQSVNPQSPGYGLQGVQQLFGQTG